VNTTINRTLAASAALSAAAIAFAGIASADGLAGTYIRVLGSSGGMMQSTVTYTPCGPDCIHGQTSGSVAYDLHPQGAGWVGTYALNSGTPCTVTVDPAAMTETHVCTDGTNVPMTLTPA
jgi:hypothetical protein